MFNGIIKHTGKIDNITRRNNNCSIQIISKMKFSKKSVFFGDFLVIFEKKIKFLFGF